MTNHELTILTPSRGRPKNAVKMYEAFRNTCTSDTKLVILVDEDDPTLSMYYKLLTGIGQVNVVKPEKRGMVAALQYGYDNYKSYLGFAVGFMGDDHLPRTVGWDTEYLNTLKELKTGLVYGDDLYQGEAIATQIAMTSDIPDALGYMCPPGFDHLCVDVVWKDWGQAIDKIKYLPGVVVEHMHYLAGKSKKDVGYAAVNNKTVADHDNGYYREYRDNGLFDKDVEKLKKLFVDPSKGLMDVVNATRGAPAKTIEKAVNEVFTEAAEGGLTEKQVEALESVRPKKTAPKKIVKDEDGPEKS